MQEVPRSSYFSQTTQDDVDQLSVPELLGEAQNWYRQDAAWQDCDWWEALTGGLALTSQVWHNEICSSAPNVDLLRAYVRGHRIEAAKKRVLE